MQQKATKQKKTTQTQRISIKAINYFSKQAKWETEPLWAIIDRHIAETEELKQKMKVSELKHNHDGT